MKEKIETRVKAVQNNISYQVIFALLALMSAGMLIYEITAEDIDPYRFELLNEIDLLIAYIFLTDFLAGLYFADKKIKHIKMHWIDLLSSIPLSEDLFKAFRILRFTRFIRLLRATSTGMNFKSSAKYIWDKKHKDNV